jgi:protein SPT2
VGARKRRRSESLSSSDLDSDYSRKRPRPASALSSQIWQMITGKDRSQYVDNVFSDDDDDMEVSMAEVAREEARALVILLYLVLPKLMRGLPSALFCSLKAAQREDQSALEEEKRHEAEKRKKRLMRDKGNP